MIDSPQIVQVPAQSIACIPLCIPRAEIRNVMGPGLAELRAAVEEQGIAITGPWFTHHLRISPEVFDFEICLPVASRVATAGRVRPSERPEMTAARTEYHGPYEGLGPAWGEFDAWVRSRGLLPAADLWECYLAGPESSSDPAAWRAELLRPLIAAI